MNISKYLWVYGGLFVAVFFCLGFVVHHPKTSSDWAAWASAVGSIGAVGAAFSVSNAQTREGMRREREARTAALVACLAIFDAAAQPFEAICEYGHKNLSEQELADSQLQSQVCAGAVTSLKEYPIHQIASPEAVAILFEARSFFFLHIGILSTVSASKWSDGQIEDANCAVSKLQALRSRLVKEISKA